MAAQQIQEPHERSLQKSSILSGQQMEKVIPPETVVRVLNEAKISFVLVGAYGLAGWRKEGRATEDVDVVVALRQVKKAVNVLCTAFPHLEAVDLPVVVRLRDHETKDVAIDVMKPLQPPYRDVFRNTHTVTSGGQTFRVPSLEMAIVMKFSAMTSLYRAEEDKHRDAHDFIRMVKQNPEYDKNKLMELGSLLYADGGKDVVELARKAGAGETLNL
jgi:hypothetical protein